MYPYGKALLLHLLTPLSFGLSTSSDTWYSGYDGTADPKAQIVTDDGFARFTVLTDSIVRMEYAKSGHFDDRPTVNILNRRLPVPDFTVLRDGMNLKITTKNLELRFQPPKVGEPSFFQTSITLLTYPFTTWTVASTRTGNLHGTVRTLDRVGEAVDLTCPPLNNVVHYSTHCEEGLVSRDGWVVVDDSIRPRISLDAHAAGQHQDPEWPWPISPPEANIESLRAGSQIVYTDWYFFGHGLNFKGALADYVQLAGRIPLLPRYALGPGLSRWYAWNELEQVEHNLQDGFASHGFPLDQLSVDMDWHPSYPRGHLNDWGVKVDGWTGYSVYKPLFPELGAFLAHAKRRGIFLNFNLHPASGVQFHEHAYAAMAQALGIAQPETVPFDIANQSYSAALFAHVLRPLEVAGLDFWWIDYQQTPFSTVAMLNPTFLCNFAYWTNPWRYGKLWSGLARNHIESVVWPPDFGPATVTHRLQAGRRLHNDRPYLFGRFGGLGGHRYPVGFAGDTAVKWRVLRYETYFSPTSSNVGFMWTHDIGGFEGEPPPELLTRWVQWGAFSSLLRMHSSKLSPGRTPWSFPNPYLSVMRNYYRLRARMVPYLATAQRLSHDTGLQLLRPMYYTHPLAEAAYSDQGLHQFWLGDDIWVAPIAAPCAKDRGSTATGTAMRAALERKEQKAKKFNATLAQRNGLVAWPIWVPPGTWIEWFSWGRVQGDSTPAQIEGAPAAFNHGPGSFVVRNYSLSELPVFSPPGTILTLRTLPDVGGTSGSGLSEADLAQWVLDGARAEDSTLGAPPPPGGASVLGLASQPYHDLTLWVLPLTPDQGLAENVAVRRSTRLYEDDGLSKAAQESDAYAWTNISCTWTRKKDASAFTQDAVRCEISAPNGKEGVPARRALLWRFIGSLIPERVLVDGQEAFWDQAASPDAAGDHGAWFPGKAAWAYHGPSLSTWVRVPARATNSPLSVALHFPAGLFCDDKLLTSGYSRTLKRSLLCKDEVDRGYGLIYPSDVKQLLELSAAATSIPANDAHKQLSWLRRIPNLLEQSIQLFRQLHMSSSPSALSLQHRCLGALQDGAEGFPPKQLPSSDPRVRVASQPPKYGSNLSHSRGSAPGEENAYSSTPGTDEVSAEEGLEDYYPQYLFLQDSMNQNIQSSSAPRDEL